MIHVTTSKDQITIVIDVGPDEIRRAAASKSGKSTIVASTSGFTNVETDHGTLALSLNLIKKG